MMIDWRNTLNGYVAFYRGRRAEVYAETSYQAQQSAAKLMKAKKAYEVAIVLAEKDGAPVAQSGASLGPLDIG